jgi:hypothetical protein
MTRATSLAIFHECHQRFRECALMPKHLSQATLERSRGKNAAWAWTRPHENYISDFLAVARRALGEGTLEYRIFTARYVLGAAPALICAQMQMNRPTLEGMLDDIRARLGQAFSETQPFPLYPPAAYFTASTVPVQATITTPAVRQFVPVRPSLAPAATL